MHKNSLEQLLAVATSASRIVHNIECGERNASAEKRMANCRVNKYSTAFKDIQNGTPNC
jgi:hypothetical protein